MIRAVLASAHLLLLAVSLTAQVPAPPPALISGARILDPSAGRYLPPSFVLIRDGRIASVSPDEPAGLPADVQRLVLKDATLVPGLVDARGTAAPADGLDADYFRLLALAHGVTAERAFNLRAGWGQAQKRRIETGDTLAPRLFVGGRGIDQGARPDLWLFDAQDANAAKIEAVRQAAAGVDWIAGYEHLPPNSVRALTAAVRGTAVRVAALPGASSMSELAAAGVHSIDALQWPLAARTSDDEAAADSAWAAAPPRELAALARRLVSARVTLVPSLASLLAQAHPEDAGRDPGLASLPAPRRDALLARLKTQTAADTARARKAWAAQADFVLRFVKARGRIATGSAFDVTGIPAPGTGVHRELAALVRAGLTPAEAIRAATSNGAVMLDAANTVGAIAPGRAADLIVVSGDPLAAIADLSKVTHVIRRGEILEPKTLVARARR